MSLLRATDRAIKARQAVYEMCQQIKSCEQGTSAPAGILKSCQQLTDLVGQIVSDLESTLVPDGETVAVTFFPFRQDEGERADIRVREPGVGYKTDSDPKDSPTSTMVLPSHPQALQ
jgi:hypothetical protein